MSQDEGNGEYIRHLVLAAVPAFISIVPDLYRIGKDWAEQRKKVSSPPKKRKSRAKTSFHAYVAEQKSNLST